MFSCSKLVVSCLSVSPFFLYASEGQLLGYKHGLEIAQLLSLNKNPNLKMAGIYKEYLKEAKLLLGKSCGLVYLLIILKSFLLGVWGQVFSNKCIPAVPTNGPWPISLCCCIAVAPSRLGTTQSPAELKGAPARSHPRVLLFHSMGTEMQGE